MFSNTEKKRKNALSVDLVMWDVVVAAGEHTFVLERNFLGSCYCAVFSLTSTRSTACIQVM